MIHEAIFSHAEGSGYITDHPDEIKSILNNTTVMVMFGDTPLVIGSFTDLDGFYNRPVKFMGVAGKPEDSLLEMIFYIGESWNKHYYKSVFWVDQNRFYIQYQPNGGRDYNRVNGVWDFQRQKGTPKKRKEAMQLQLFK